MIPVLRTPFFLHHLKLATTAFAPFSVKNIGFEVPVIAPLHELKRYPILEVAFRLTDVPLLYQQPAEQSGLILPSPAGFTEVKS
jgi:hypothetical protein